MDPDVNTKLWICKGDIKKVAWMEPWLYTIQFATGAFACVQDGRNERWGEGRDR